MSALPCPLAHPFAAADQAYATITELLRSEEARHVKHSDLERQLEAMGHDLMRKLLQAHLDTRQPGEASEPVEDAAGQTLTPTPMHTRSLETIFGTVEVTRTGYRADDTPSLHPLDGALNLPPEKYSLEVRRRVAIEATKGSFEEGIETLKTYTGAHIAKRQFEELVQRAAQDFEAFYEERQKAAVAEGQPGPILVLSIDGKGVVMRPEDLREETRRAAATREQTWTARLGGGGRLHAKRMAAVAAVYTVQRYVRTPEQILPVPGKPREVAVRPSPEEKRVWASLEQSSEKVIEEMFDEAAHRDPSGEKNWIALVDGNITQIEYLQKVAEERKIPLLLVVDLIHVAQRGFAASCQRSALSIQLLQEPGKHAFDLGGLLCQVLVVSIGEEVKISSEQEVIFQFASGTASDTAEASQFPITIPAATLRQVGTDRRTGAADLTGQTIRFRAGKIRRDPVDLQGEEMRFLPYLELPKVLHRSSIRPARRDSMGALYV